jgi:Domain of unknown function (DUF4380)
MTDGAKQNSSLATSVVAWLLVLVASTASRVHADPPNQSTVATEQIDFMGWKQAWQMRNSACRLVIVPQIGRVMEFAAADGPNLLWVNPTLTGQTVDHDDAKWHNFGGEKIWPTQQDLWEKYAHRKGWPPPYCFDCAPTVTEPIKNGVRLKYIISPDFGATLTREIVMDDKQPLVRIHQWFEKTQGEPVPMSLWSNMQVKTPLFAMLPDSGASRCHKLKPTIDSCFAEGNSVLSIRNDEASVQKVGVVPDAQMKDGWVAGVFDHSMIVVSRRLEPGADYPDNGCPGEIFTADKNGHMYVELELLSPLRTLKIGDELVSDEVWQIVPVTAADVDDIETAGTIARKANDAALLHLTTDH